LIVEPGGEARAELLHARFNLKPADERPGLQIVSDATGLTLRDSRDPGRKPLRVSYSLPALRITRRQPLARALGRKARSVVDATAGLGTDALRLASLGCTVTAMESGAYWGYVGLVEGLVARIKAEYGQPMKVIATGGLAPLFAGGTDAFEAIDADLTLRGLLAIYRANRPAPAA